jgi:uncharacterized membrane protein
MPAVARVGSDARGNGLRAEAALEQGWSYFFLGTFAPFLRASERPMAMACFLLFTLPPLPPLPERNVPLFFRRMALSTDLLAPLLYFRRDEDFFFVGMQFLRCLEEKDPVKVV